MEFGQCRAASRSASGLPRLCLRSASVRHRPSDRLVTFCRTVFGGGTQGIQASTITERPHSDGELTGLRRHGLLRNVTDTRVRLWRRVHMDLVRYAGCVCRPSC
ncbi:putative leader peptide [Streptomyces sp. NPDC005813]|uniref:putative leader peptide n=1 Tax=Streptomyces sp. NPDC005813 TaxID=3155592 RepID=UPI0033C8573B